MQSSDVQTLLQTLLSAIANGDTDATVGDLLAEAGFAPPCPGEFSDEDSDEESPFAHEDEGVPCEITRVDSFEEAGIMTYNKGVVLSMGPSNENAKFQITIVEC